MKSISSSILSKRGLICFMITAIIHMPCQISLDFEKNIEVSTKKDGPRKILGICLKTGVETAYDRVPIQLLTFLKNQNPLVISDYEETIGDYHVKDMLPLEKKRLVLPESRHSGSITKDEQKPDEATQGWKLDAWKNIPGFNLMHQLFPYSDWHVMLDDDTYLFINNLETHLKTLNAESRYYLGSPNMFVGCDNVKAFGEGPSFAHGGSGIVMSKASLQKLVDGTTTCLSKYNTCWAGDIRTSLCLRDQGILVDNDASKGSFHGHPPQKHNYHNPCEKPFTYFEIYLAFTIYFPARFSSYMRWNKRSKEKEEQIL
eukprot:NODE_295_length_11479_cov_0.183480.p2 type:complete len:315 gc:universal NODE_295_length_11479_cov_0.183480:10714-9770(-)